LAIIAYRRAVAQGDHMDDFFFFHKGSNRFGTDENARKIGEMRQNYAVVLFLLTTVEKDGKI
jgi:hypothetical protein